MMSLPESLLNHCRQLFLNCDQFESYSTLRTFLAIHSELSPFRYGLKQANSQADLVDSFIAFILEQKLIGGKPAFPVFLSILRNCYEDNRQDELSMLLDEIQNFLVIDQNDILITPLQKQALKDKLLTLDFRPQVRQFKEVIEQNRIAAFLIHGRPGYGQGSLIYRLIKFKEEWKIGKQIKIDTTARGVGKDFSLLWREVARQMQLPYNTDINTLAENVCQWWQTLDVIFIFSPVEYIPKDILAQWIEQFWKPIVSVASQKQNLTKSNTHLLLFLVDFEGRVCDTNLPLLDQLGETHSSYAPLKLPPNSKFPENELEIWIDTAAEALPSGLNAVEVIEDTENGIPDLVYDKIWEPCGTSWQGEISL